MNKFDVNYTTNAIDFQQHLENLPAEILNQPRFFEVGADKIPRVKDWGNPKNQKLPAQVLGIAGFDTTGHDIAPDYFFVDFDHVLNPDGSFVNQAAEKWFNYLSMSETFCEISKSGDGLHFLFNPTKGKFPPLTGSTHCTIFLDETNPKSKIELFYRQGARYCLFTGNVFKCSPKTPIVQGEIADEFISQLLNELTVQNASTNQNAAQVYDIPLAPLSESELQKLLSFLPCAKLTRNDWWLVGAIIEYEFGEPGFEIWRAWSETDSARYSLDVCKKQWADAVNRHKRGIGKPAKIGTLIDMAKKFGYKPPKKAPNHAEKFNGYDFLHDTNYDLDNARRLEKYRGDFFRWLTDDEHWLLYDNGIWLRRSSLSSCLYPFAEQFADEMLNFAKILADKFSTLEQPTVSHAKFADKTPEEKIYDKAKAQKDKAFEVADYFKKRKNYSAAIDLMKGCNSILITADDLNKNKNLIACQNGVIDLQTGKLFDFAPKFLITNQVAAIYDAQASTSFVEKFLSDILPDDATRRAVLRYLGYCLTGEKNVHISQFWRGSGANGKSTILDALIRLLASYAVKLPCAALLDSNRPIDGNAATPALALLDGDKRLALVDELPRNSRLNAALYKTITGDETIAARPLYGNFRNIQLRAKLILNGNHLPSFDVDDGGLQRRINNVEFTQKFEGDRADSDLPKKLATPENRCALLKILVEEATQYYQHGLLESEDMKKAKAAYFAESDFISDFVDDYCDIGEGEILRKEFIDKLKAEHFADTRRYSSQELFKAVCDSLARNDVVYTKNRLNQNIFKGISWQKNTDFGGEIVSSKDYAMP